MTKRVLDVGNCSPDHASICELIEERFAARVVQTHGAEDTLDALRNSAFDLVLVNRKLDRDYSDGLEIIKQIKADAAIANVPVMMITNYDDQQSLAIQEGAVRGFGKLELHESGTLERLTEILG